MADQTYEDAVVDTFRKRALRTAYIIDDQFPTYKELATLDDAKQKFKELDLAVQLYDLFRRNHIPCDVENVAASVKGEIERIRKSDLVVLDYHLGVGEDTRASIGLVRDLSRTEHFNTVVLYTAEPKLDDVWLNLALGLRGGWSGGGPRADRRGRRRLVGPRRRRCRAAQPVPRDDDGLRARAESGNRRSVRGRAVQGYSRD